MSQTIRSSSNWGPRAMQLAVLVDDEAVAVEDELVLAADEVAEDDVGEVVTGTLDQHALALAALAHVVRGRRDVHDHLGPGEGLLAGRRTRLPDVLADREPERRAVDAQERRAVPDLEVALLVEDAVVRQEDLPVDALNAPVREDRERVVDVLRMLGEPDQGDHVVHLFGDLVERPPPGGEEMRLQEEVLGRVAVHRELGKDGHLGARSASPPERVHDRGGVAVDVAHCRVDLGKREAQRLSDRGHSVWILGAPATHTGSPGRTDGRAARFSALDLGYPDSRQSRTTHSSELSGA